MSVVADDGSTGVASQPHGLFGALMAPLVCAVNDKHRNPFHDAGGSPLPTTGSLLMGSPARQARAGWWRRCRPGVILGGNGPRRHAIYDAVVVGARCAGAPTAMLLARKSHRVLLVDRDRFPSDMTQSTHLIHPLGVAHLRAWGILPAIEARATSFTDWRVDLHGVVLTGTPPAVDGHPTSHGPRRRLLDGTLAEAAVAAGAEFRDGTRVVDLIERDGRIAGVAARDRRGGRFDEPARIVIGADGPGSVVARRAGARESHREPIVQSNIWSYWSGIALDHVRLYIRERAGAFAFPSSDGAVLVAANLMHDEFVRARRDRENAYHARIEEVAPDLRAMTAGAHRVDDFHAGCTRGFVRRAAGPGWALVGDAGMKKDPVTAQGISTAFRCAEMLAEAVDDGLSGRRPLDDALAGYEAARNRWLLQFYHFTAALARFAKPTEEQAAFYRAARDDAAMTARLFGAVALTDSPDALFAPTAGVADVGAQPAARSRAQESRKPTTRLNTGRSGVESGSGQK